MWWVLIRSASVYSYFSAKICYSDTSIEYPQHMFSMKNKKKYQSIFVEEEALSGAMIRILRNTC